jgi:multidrug efflux pump
MWREGRDYAITVQGDVVEGMQGATVTRRCWPQLQASWRPHAHGLPHRGGRRGGRKQQGPGLDRGGVPMMLFIIFTLLMLQLHSFSRAMLVFLTGPLGIAGVAGALLLLDRPFGFVALLGVIALMGMIMRNSVILIDQIEQDRARRAGLGRHRRVGGAALAPDRADGRGRRAGHDPAVAQRVLGPDGGGHHGRADRRHG